MIDDNLIEDQNGELPHDVTKEIADGLEPDENGVLTIPDNFDGVICGSVFEGREDLKIVVAENIKEIKACAFKDCKHLKRIDFLNATEIGACAFDCCKELDTINIPQVSKIEEGAFECCAFEKIDLPSIDKVEQFTFYGCKNLKEIIIPNVEKVGKKAFCECETLGKIDLPKLSIIGISAFQNCFNLREAILPEVKSIRAYAFQQSRSLETLYLPKIKRMTSNVFELTYFIKEIHTSTLEQCKLIYENIHKSYKLRMTKGEFKIFYEDKVFKDSDLLDNSSEESANVEATNGDITKEVADGLKPNEEGMLEIPDMYDGIIYKEAFSDREDIKSVLARNISKVETSAFSQCKNLYIAHLLKATEISNCAFIGCENLLEIDIPQATTIGIKAFSSTNLKEVVCPEVETIKESAFYFCQELTKIDFPKAKTIEKNAFYYCCDLEEASFQSLEKVEANIFGKDSMSNGAKRIEIPNATEIGEGAFEVCNQVVEFICPKVTTIRKFGFAYCTNLKKIHLESIETIETKGIYCWNDIEEIYTSSPEQCELIFNSLEDDVKGKIIEGGCKLFYGGEVWDCNSYVEKVKEEEELRLKQEKERLKQEKQQIIDNFFEAFKTPETEIREGELCPVCQSKLEKLEGDNFVCTMHEDPGSKVQHQICKECFLGLINFNYPCPMCKADLEIPDDVRKAIKELNELEQQGDN